MDKTAGWLPPLEDALTALQGKTVALDFDVPIHSYSSGWTGPVPEDEPTPGALEMVRRLLDAHVNLVIYTTRAETPEGAAATIDWLARHGFPPVPVTAGKPLAVAYIDDRAVPFTGSWAASVRAASLLVDGARLDSTAHDCGHTCCDERHDPMHDHFLAPDNCPSCVSGTP